MKILHSRNSLCLAILTSLIAFSLLGCESGRLDREAWIERGRTALKPFKQELMGALAEGLQEGPEAAIDVCHRVAPEIAVEHSSPGVQLGRTSHRLRNEQNAAKPWMQSLLAKYAAAPGDSQPEVVRLSGNRIGYVEPIYVKSMCLTCHGSNLAPSVAAMIDEHYPRDQARGFEEGDFRGLFWVEFNGVQQN